MNIKRFCVLVRSIFFRKWLRLFGGREEVLVVVYTKCQYTGRLATQVHERSWVVANFRRKQKRWANGNSDVVGCHHCCCGVFRQFLEEVACGSQ